MKNNIIIFLVTILFSNLLYAQKTCGADEILKKNLSDNPEKIIENNIDLELSLLQEVKQQRNNNPDYGLDDLYSNTDSTISVLGNTVSSFFTSYPSIAA